MSAAVYRHFSATGELLYIGYSVRPLDRNLNHKSSAPWFKEIATITIEWFDTSDAALAAEIEAIKRECPRENIKDMPDDLFKKRPGSRIREAPAQVVNSLKPHPQLDAVQVAYGLRVCLGNIYFLDAGLTPDVELEIRESGRELKASEVSGLRRSLGTTYKKLERIGLHRRNQG